MKVLLVNPEFPPILLDFGGNAASSAGRKTLLPPLGFLRSPPSCHPPGNFAWRT